VAPNFNWRSCRALDPAQTRLESAWASSLVNAHLPFTSALPVVEVLLSHLPLHLLCLYPDRICVICSSAAQRAPTSSPLRGTIYDRTLYALSRSVWLKNKTSPPCLSAPKNVPVRNRIPPRGTIALQSPTRHPLDPSAPASVTRSGSLRSLRGMSLRALPNPRRSAPSCPSVVKQKQLCLTALIIRHSSFAPPSLPAPRVPFMGL